jgi:hypothetical protein
MASKKDILARVWDAIRDHAERRDDKASSPAVKKLRALQKSITADEAIAGAEAWLDRHAARLAIRRGKPGGELKQRKLHPFQRALVDRFGFLEIAIPQARMHRHGLRVFGWAPDYPACHLPTQEAQHAAMCASAKAKLMRDEKDEWTGRTKLVPVLATLEGVLNEWAASPTTIVAIDDYTSDQGGTRGGTAFHLGSPDRPSLGPGFAFLAKLFILEQRLAEIAELRQLATTCGVALDLDGVLRCEPNITIDLQYWSDHSRVEIARELARGAGKRSEIDPLLSNQADALQERVAGAGVRMQHNRLIAVLSVKLAELDFPAALDRLAHIAKMHEDPALADPEAPPPAPPEPDEQQLAAAMLTITELTEKALGNKKKKQPPQWRDLAAMRAVPPAELTALLQFHQTWLHAHRDDRHAWSVHEWLEVMLAMYGGTADPAQLSLWLRDLRGLSLAGKDLTAANLVQAIADEVDFSNAALAHICMTDSSAAGARFDGADLRGADFSRTNLRGASFRNANCAGTDFEDCDLSTCDFTGATR